MGRVYTYRPRNPGDRTPPARAGVVVRATGQVIPRVCRVEFDDDADEGMATVHVILLDETGRGLLGLGGREVQRASFRHDVSLVAPAVGEGNARFLTRINRPGVVGMTPDRPAGDADTPVEVVG